MQDTAERKDVYTRITAQIVEHLEKGVRPWIRPWNAEHAAGRITRPLRHDGQPYSGINVLSLWMSALGQNFTAPIWMTFRQASELNARVRKGEKGSLVAYANAITCTERDDKTGEDVEREIHYMKGYTVFNVEQIEGLPEIFYAKAVPTAILLRASTTQRSFSPAWVLCSSMAETAPITRRNSTMCRCLPLRLSAMRSLTIQFSPMKLTRWTRHPQRLDRDLGRKQWGDEGYSREELVAELGSAFLCADLELHQEAREDTPPISRHGWRP